jgi:hypothetical protein
VSVASDRHAEALLHHGEEPLVDSQYHHHDCCDVRRNECRASTRVSWIEEARYRLRTKQCRRSRVLMLICWSKVRWLASPGVRHRARMTGDTWRLSARRRPTGPEPRRPPRDHTAPRPAHRAAAPRTWGESAAQLPNDGVPVIARHCSRGVRYVAVDDRNRRDPGPRCCIAIGSRIGGFRRISVLLIRISLEGCS